MLTSCFRAIFSDITSHTGVGNLVVIFGEGLERPRERRYKLCVKALSSVEMTELLTFVKNSIVAPGVFRA